MKHILNNLTEQEKNAIREQHTGGMKVATDKFNQRLESKLGDVKPILSEQTKSFDPKTFNPGTALIKPQKPEPEIVKVPGAMKTPKGKTIPVIKIKLGDSNLIDLTIMDDTGYRGSSGAIFYGKFKNEKYWYQLHFYCNQDTVYHNFAVEHIGLHDGKISPEAVNLLNKAAGCDAYVKNQDTSSDDVTLAEQDIQSQTGNVTTGQTDSGKAELIQIMIDKLNNMAKDPKFNASGVAQVVYNNAAHFLNKTDIFNDQTKYGQPFPTKVPFAPQGIAEQMMKPISQGRNKYKEVVNFLKKSGINGYTFKEAIEGDESLGIILELPQDKTSQLWVEPDGSYMMSKKGKVFNSGKWNWDGVKLTLVKE